MCTTQLFPISKTTTNTTAADPVIACPACCGGSNRSSRLQTKCFCCGGRSEVLRSVALTFYSRGLCEVCGCRPVKGRSPQAGVPTCWGAKCDRDADLEVAADYAEMDRIQANLVESLAG